MRTLVAHIKSRDYKISCKNSKYSSIQNFSTDVWSATFAKACVAIFASLLVCAPPFKFGDYAKQPLHLHSNYNTFATVGHQFEKHELST
jgi:hypothetical protein